MSEPRTLAQLAFAGETVESIEDALRAIDRRRPASEAEAARMIDDVRRLVHERALLRGDVMERRT